MHRRLRPVVLALSLAAALALAGCTTAGPATSTPSTSPTQSPSATPTQAPTASASPTSTPATTLTPAMEYNATVTEVTDGDTMTVRFAEGGTDTIRLAGVDTPEFFGDNDPALWEGIPDTDQAGVYLASWADNASQRAKRQLVGESVRLVVDEAGPRRDSNGILRVYLYHEGDLYNEQLLADGLARATDGPATRAEEFGRLESAARSEGVGLWNYSEEDD